MDINSCMFIIVQLCCPCLAVYLFVAIFLWDLCVTLRATNTSVCVHIQYMASKTDSDSNQFCK